MFPLVLRGWKAAGERETKTHLCERGRPPPACAPMGVGEGACSPGMCPRPESSQRPLSLRAAPGAGGASRQELRSLEWGRGSVCCQGRRCAERQGFGGLAGAGTRARGCPLGPGFPPAPSPHLPRWVRGAVVGVRGVSRVARADGGWRPALGERRMLCLILTRPRGRPRPRVMCPPIP